MASGFDQTKQRRSNVLFHLQYGAWSVRAADRWEVKAELREKRGAAEILG